MTFNINEFLSTVNRYNGLQRAEHFSVMITSPKWLQQTQGTFIIQDLPFLCDSATLPGVQFGTNDYQRHGYGLYERTPIRTDFTELPLTFYSDGKGNVMKFFQSWMMNVQNFDTTRAPTRTRANNAYMYDYQFPDWYETTIEIYTYDATGTKILTWKLDRAYPILLNNNQVAWDMTNTILKVPVTFSFRGWTTELSDNSGTGSNSLQYTIPGMDPSINVGQAGIQQYSQAISNIVNNQLNANVYQPLANLLNIF